MKVVCAWCDNVLEYDNNDNINSHGICMVCAIKELEKAGIDANPFFVAYLRRKQPDRIITPGETIQDPDKK
jgi:hypothetical protein